MTDAAQQPSRPKWIRSTLILVAGFLLGYVTSDLSRWYSSLAPEYNTARTIADINEFVKKNSRWPSSWQDLGTPSAQGVVVNWTIDLRACDRHDIMTAIRPRTGRYRTYPHAESQLNSLWLLVQQLRDSSDEERSD